MTTHTHCYLDIDELQLDTDNPRIKKYIEMYGDNPTADQIHMALNVSEGEDSQSGGTTFISLKESIRTNGGIIHPIIVNEREDGRKVVIEGNTRLAIYQLFDSDNVKGDWKKIPALLFENLPQERIDAIRLQSHLVGPRAWDPYSKAKYLHSLHTQEFMTFERIVDFCGGRKKEVQDYIDAYNDMEKYYRKVVEEQGDNFDTTRFSGFVELQNPRVKNAIFSTEIDGRKADLYDFSRWINEEKIYPLNTVRSLPQILANPRARKVFLEKNAKEALKELDTRNDQVNLSDAKLEDICSALINKIQTLSFSELMAIKDNPEGDKHRLIFDLSDEIELLTEQLSQ